MYVMSRLEFVQLLGDILQGAFALATELPLATLGEEVLSSCSAQAGALRASSAGRPHSHIGPMLVPGS